MGQLRTDLHAGARSAWRVAVNDGPYRRIRRCPRRHTLEVLAQELAAAVDRRGRWRRSRRHHRRRRRHSRLSRRHLSCTRGTRRRRIAGTTSARRIHARHGTRHAARAGASTAAHCRAAVRRRSCDRRVTGLHLVVLRAAGNAPQLRARAAARGCAARRRTSGIWIRARRVRNRRRRRPRIAPEGRQGVLFVLPLPRAASQPRGASQCKNAGSKPVHQLCLQVGP